MRVNMEVHVVVSVLVAGENLVITQGEPRNKVQLHL